MGTESRRQRRQNDPAIQAKREDFNARIGITRNSSGGWGLGDAKSIPATGQTPRVNPFMLPKKAGLNVYSQTFPSNYYVEWNLSTWRQSCDQAIKQGYTMSYSTMVNWCFESSAFVQSLFEAWGNALEKVDVFVIDKKGNKIETLTDDLCKKLWFNELRKEILFSCFWGFSGINFDPFSEKVYKYPMQDIDPINRLLKQNSFSFYDGIEFDSNANLLFVQPSTSYERFLGFMQPITRAFIQMNLNNTNWVAAGRRLAFPIMTVGYPQGDGAKDADGNDVNPFRDQAINVLETADPSNGLLYPYTIDANGNIVKSLQVDFQGGQKGSAHSIFQDFNTEQKNEIRELILGGTLTSSTGINGARSLGEVHERKFNAVIESKHQYVMSVLNGDFLKKIKKFYRNWPEGARFEINKAKELPLEDIKIMSDIMVANGKKLTDKFFEANGISPDFFEDVAQVKEPVEVEPEKIVQMARQETFFSSLKKKALT